MSAAEEIDELQVVRARMVLILANSVNVCTRILKRKCCSGTRQMLQ